MPDNAKLQTHSIQSLLNAIASWPFLFTLALTCATWFSGDIRFQSEITGSEPLYKLGDGTWNWLDKASVSIDFENQAIEIVKTEPGRVGARVLFELDDTKPKFIQYKAVLRTIESNPLPTDKNLNKTLMHLSFKGNGKVIRHASVTRAPLDTTSLIVHDLIQIPAHADLLRLTFHSRIQGRWLLDNIELNAASLSKTYLFVRTLLVVLWMALAILLMLKILAKIKLVYMAIVSLAMLLILFATAASRPLLAAVLIPLGTWVSEKVGVVRIPDIEAFLRHSHIAMFVPITLLLLIFAKKLGLSAVQIIFYCVLLAVASEVIQRHSITRSPQLDDLLQDFIGIGIAVLIYLVWRLCKTLVFRHRA